MSNRLYSKKKFTLRERKDTNVTQVIGWSIAAGIMMLLLVLPRYSHAADINLVINIIECESSGRYNVYGREDGGESYGIAQFKEETFEQFKRKAHHPEWRYKNPIHQLRLMNWMLDHGYGAHWTCYRKLMAGRVMDGKVVAK